MAERLQAISEDDRYNLSDLYPEYSEKFHLASLSQDAVNRPIRRSNPGSTMLSSESISFRSLLVGRTSDTSESDQQGERIPKQAPRRYRPGTSNLRIEIS
jgi:hypothetical protein